jgi:hypothetical protein
MLAWFIINSALLNNLAVPGTRLAQVDDVAGERREHGPAAFRDGPWSADHGGQPPFFGGRSPSADW